MPNCHTLLAQSPKTVCGCCLRSGSLEAEVREQAFVKEFIEKCFQYKEKIGKNRRRKLRNAVPWDRNCTTSWAILRRCSAFCNPMRVSHWLLAVRCYGISNSLEKGEAMSLSSHHTQPSVDGCTQQLSIYLLSFWGRWEHDYFLLCIWYSRLQVKGRFHQASHCAQETPCKLTNEAKGIS